MSESEFEMQYCDQNFCKVAKGDKSNQYSTESEISGSESCVHFDTIEASDITGYHLLILILWVPNVGNLSR